MDDIERLVAEVKRLVVQVNEWRTKALILELKLNDLETAEWVDNK